MNVRPAAALARTDSATRPAASSPPASAPASRAPDAFSTRPPHAPQAAIVPAPPKPLTSVTQAIPFATAEQRRSAGDALRAANPGNWSVNLPDVNVFGQLVRARRDATGPEVKTTPEQATAVAREFLAKNAALLGLEPEDLGALKTGAVLQTPTGLSVAFSGDRSPAGYEAFGELTRHLAVNLTVGRDGKVVGVDNEGAALTAGNMLPGLSIGTTPGLAADSPAVRGAVLDQPLTWIEGGDEGVPEKRTDFGTVQPGDVSSTRLTVMQDWSAAGRLQLTLAYQLTVSKGGHEWGFTVDAGTGQLLDSGQLGPVV